MIYIFSNRLDNHLDGGFSAYYFNIKRQAASMSSTPCCKKAPTALEIES